MPKALQHEFPYWQDDPHAEDGSGESRHVWPGRPRYVSARRARKLRKRGVPLLPLHAVHDRSGGQHAPGYVEPTSPNGRARYAWFEPYSAPLQREALRRIACYNTWCDANAGRRGRKHELATRLAGQRERLVALRYARSWRRVAPAIAAFWAGQVEALASMGRAQWGVADEAHHVNPQLYVYAKAAALFDGPHNLPRSVVHGFADDGPFEGLRYAKYDTPNEARALLGDKLSDELLAQRDAGQHYDACDCAACDGSLAR